MSLSYTLAVTSCNRFDLLEVTLGSLLPFLDPIPSKFVMIQDGPEVFKFSPWLDPMGDMCQVIQNDPRIGQIKSCDRLMEAIDTEWILWAEDDWRFKEGCFLQESYDILAQYPEIVTVSLRGRAWNHPLREFPDWPFLIAEPGWQGGWGGMAFNPGLRRKSDWVKMGPYAQVGTDMYACQSELALSKKYLAAGYRIADLGRPIIEHLGHGRSKTKEKF